MMAGTPRGISRLALSAQSRILVIRRDNIGDLICTTPLIRGLRASLPGARIDALVNSYNQPVLANNADVDHVYFYTKAKHRGPTETAVGVYWQRLRLMLQLRFTHYDLVILANGGYMRRPLGLARWVSPKHIAGFVPAAPAKHSAIVDLPVAIDDAPLHEVEDIYRLLTPLGIAGSPPGLQLQPAPEARSTALAKLAEAGWNDDSPLTIAIHISARKVLQRWPGDRFGELMQRLNAALNCRFLLFWSPGDENNALHPGDDGKAAAIIAATKDLPVIAYPTDRLDDLIGGLSVCDAMICSDGGAMHVGAGLGLPIVCFFGNSDAAKWHPWKVPYRVLQKPSRNVNDISVEETVSAFRELKQAAAL